MPKEMGRWSDPDDQPLISPIQKHKKNFDDELRNIPSVKTSISDIDGNLRIFSNSDLGDDRVVIKLDKEMPEISVTVSSILIESGESVLLPNAGNGALGLIMAIKNPNSKIFLYENNLGKRLLTQKNIRSNFNFSKDVNLLNDQELELMGQNPSVDKIIFNGLDLNSNSSKSLFINDLIKYHKFLKLGGSFYLISKTSSGADSHRNILESVFNQTPEVIGRGNGGHKIFVATKSNEIVGNVVSTKRSINFNINNINVSFETDEALFSKNDIDKGSRMLLESVDLTLYKSLLDFGCGWGSIGIIAALSNKSGRVVMIDNKQRAVDVAISNVQKNNLEERVQVIRTDSISDDVDDKFDLVLSNPPFHEKTKDLINLFKQIMEKMEKRGIIYLVVESSFRMKFEDVLLNSFGNYQLRNKGENNYWIISAKK